MIDLLENLLTEALRENPPRRPQPRATDSERRAAIDYLDRLRDRSKVRQSLEADSMDGMRFRFWFHNYMGKDLTLEDWRKLIDDRMLKHG